MSGYRLSRLAGALASMVLLVGGAAACGGDPPATSPTTAPGATTAGQTGLVNYRNTHPEWLTQDHQQGKVSYPTSPPVGGDHNPAWQSCSGDIYPEEIANEHAVHSLEHGAVWITYRPGLPAADITRLTAKVTDRPYMMMSPYPGLDVPISLQAWGYQLKVTSSTDERIDRFIKDFRLTASPEPGATCSGGVTTTGPDPVEK